MTTDAVLQKDQSTGLYDLTIDDNGDINTADFFDTAILYSLHGERRASPDEVVEPQLRRGWIGNGDYENGSKIWLLSQARLTRTTLNRLQDEAEKALQWLVDDAHAVAISDVTATLSQGVVLLNIVIQRSRDQVVNKSYTMWENTGRGV